jgi:hypothetical protein
LQRDSLAILLFHQSEELDWSSFLENQNSHFLSLVSFRVIAKNKKEVPARRDDLSLLILRVALLS